MPTHDNSLGKNDPLGRDRRNSDNERRNRSDSEEDAEMSATPTPPSSLSTPGSVPLPVMMFGFRAGTRTTGRGIGAPVPPPPGPSAMRLDGQGPVAPLRMDELHAVLRGVLDMIDEDDFADLDGPTSGGGSPSSGRRGLNAFLPKSHSPSEDHYRAQ